MVKTVYVPPWVRQNGIGKNHKGHSPDWQVAAADTETVHGCPVTLQWCEDGETADVYDVTPATILDTFIDRVDRWARRDADVRIVYFHHLKFDLQALLYRSDHRQFFGLPKREFSIGLVPLRESLRSLTPDQLAKIPASKKWTRYMEVFADKTWFAKLHLSSRRMVWIVDSRMYFHKSLKESAKLVGSPHLKLDPPAGYNTWSDYGLGDKNLRGDPAYEAYIRQDALAQFHVAQAIKQLHFDHDIKVTVSLPQMAATIFRHNYLRETDAMPYPPPDVSLASILSFHGGKNQMRPDLGAGWYTKDPVLGGDGVYEYDIRSAYVWAMTQLPGMLAGEFQRTNELPWNEYGVVCISGRVDCPYGSIFSHDFKPIRGEFRDVWVSSWEVQGAVEQGCATLTKCHGWVWRDRSDRKPFQEYAQHFWDEKSRLEKGSLAYEMAKLLGNALYGKTMATIRHSAEIVTDERGNTREQETYKACGMFNPFIGTSITGPVRRKLHAMEHRACAMHSSTDAIKSVIPPSELPDIGDGLGDWSVENGPSPCLMLRPKLYVHEPAAGQKRKSAYHGFAKSAQQVIEAAELVLNGKQYDYFVTRCINARESLKSKQGLVTLDFPKLPKSLRVNAIKKPDLTRDWTPHILRSRLTEPQPVV
jgi:hypothetical protein